jgi:hypothetical protein
MNDSDVAELRQEIADLRELTEAMHRRQRLARESPEWYEALAAEERLIKRMNGWVRRMRRAPN